MCTCVCVRVCFWLYCCLPQNRQWALAILFGLIAHCESRNPDLRQPKGTDSRLCSAQSHILAPIHKLLCVWVWVCVCVCVSVCNQWRFNERGKRANWNGGKLDSWHFSVSIKELIEYIQDVHTYIYIWNNRAVTHEWVTLDWLALLQGCCVFRRGVSAWKDIVPYTLNLW